ncbi:MAG: class I SAM-dependent methyltransferase [Gammaproteobacteria bacterium]
MRMRAGDATEMPASNYLATVREQYEALPYPPRNPELERTRLIHKVGDNLVILNHHAFNGARDFRTGFRALVAGGGTGDATIYLAEQLRAFPGEVVHLDLSRASMAIATERARIRGLTNIRWVNESIMNLAALGLGSFDYINCTGVLHHLESTEGGLAALKCVLADDGVILLMLYGKYGRQSVYDMQALLRSYLPAGLSIPEKVRMTRALLAALPKSNSFIRDLPRWQSEIGAEGFGDAGLYDLLLHSQDRCFDVPELYQLADSAQLDILAFVDRAAAYDPLALLPAGSVSAHLASLDIRSRRAIGERMVTDLVTHEFYVGRSGAHGEASLDDEANTLVMMGAMHGKHAEIGAGLTVGGTLTFSGRGGNVTVTGTPVNRALFGLMDGRTSLASIYAQVLASVPGIGRAAVERELRQLYGALNPRGYLYLLREDSYGSRVPDYGRMPIA